MKTKTQILENLIREGHIGLDEALILLETEKEYITVPYQPYPYYPSWPTEPIAPYYGTCSEVSVYTAQNLPPIDKVFSKGDIKFQN